MAKQEKISAGNIFGVWKQLIPYVKDYKKEAILSPLLIIVEVGFEVAIPYLLSFLVTYGLQGNGGRGDLKAVFLYGGLMVAFAIISLIVGALSARFGAIAANGFGKNIRKAEFGKVQDFSFYNVDRFSTGSLITRLTTDVNFIQQTFMMLIRVAFRAPVMFVVSVILVMTKSWLIGLVFIAVIPLSAAVMIFLAKVAFPRFEKMFKKFDAMNSAVEENLIGIRVVKSFVQEEHETEKFRKSSEEVRNMQVHAEKVIVYGSPVAQFAMYAVMVAVIVIGGISVSRRNMNSGDLSAVISYISQILISLLMVAMVFVNLIISQASAKRICEVLNEESDINDDHADPDLTPADGSISFRNVSFSYSKDGDKLVLRDVNLDIKSGEKIGIIGGTGSAKTTLVQLIPRLYDVYGGEVTVGGRNVKDYKIKTLRDTVAMVLQKNVLFSGTIKENLKWGNENATDAEIEEACRNAQAHDFITSFTDGYETDLGQGGVNLSGGQKQRICIARALLKHPKIMILDDSTSAVDVMTDKKIREAFRSNLADTTVLIIAQRISSVADADKIIVLNDGMINDFGTHAELSERCEIYREVYHSQEKGAETADFDKVGGEI